MAGFKTSNRYASPPPPSRGGALKWAFIGVAAVICVPPLLRSCASPKPPPEPPVTSTPEPEVEPQRVPYYIAVASSLGSTGVHGGSTRDDAQTKALDLCEAHRRSREKKFTYVSAEECKIRGVASNFGGGLCISLSTNDIEYDYTPHVLLGPEDVLQTELRAYLTSEEGTYYNTRISPHAKTMVYCIDYFGRPQHPYDAGYTYSRP